MAEFLKRSTSQVSKYEKKLCSIRLCDILSYSSAFAFSVLQVVVQTAGCAMGIGMHFKTDESNHRAQETFKSPLIHRFLPLTNDQKLLFSRAY